MDRYLSLADREIFFKINIVFIVIAYVHDSYAHMPWDATWYSADLNFWQDEKTKIENPLKSQSLCKNELIMMFLF